MEALVFDIVLVLVGGWIIRLGWRSDNLIGVFIGTFVGLPFIVIGASFFFINTGTM